VRIALDPHDVLRDIAMDLICYRRWPQRAGEPMVTQPLMYRSIQALPQTRTLYARRLAEQEGGRR